MLITIIKTGKSPYSTDIVKKPLWDVVISSYWERVNSDIDESNFPLLNISFPDLKLCPPRKLEYPLTISSTQKKYILPSIIDHFHDWLLIFPSLDKIELWLKSVSLPFGMLSNLSWIIISKSSPEILFSLGKAIQ